MTVSMRIILTLFLPLKKCFLTFFSFNFFVAVTDSLYATEGGAGYRNTPPASSPSSYLGASTSAATESVDDAVPLELTTTKKLQHTSTSAAVAGSTSSATTFSHVSLVVVVSSV